MECKKILYYLFIYNSKMGLAMLTIIELELLSKYEHWTLFKKETFSHTVPTCHHLFYREKSYFIVNQTGKRKPKGLCKFMLQDKETAGENCGPYFFMTHSFRDLNNIPFIVILRFTIWSEGPPQSLGSSISSSLCGL